MKLSDEQFSSSLTDQQYLVHRARMERERDPFAAKAWMLTANSLFPDNFSIQLESYTWEREAGNVRESAKCLQKLCKKFPNEDLLWREIDQIMAALKKSHKTTSTVQHSSNSNNNSNSKADKEEEFWLRVYNELTESSQQRLLLQAAERSSGDTLQRARLSMILVKRFPGQTTRVGEPLIESLLGAEKQELGKNPPPLNHYRKVLVTEVLPTVMAAEKISLQPILLHKLLSVALEFIVAYVNARNSVNYDIRDPWKLMLTILEGVGSGLGWTMCKNIAKSKPEAIITSLAAVQRQAVQSDQESAQYLQFFYCSLVTCLQAIYQYFSLVEAKDNEQILVEAFLAHDSDSKLKRRKTTEDTYGPLISHGSATTIEDPLLLEFQIACGAWQLLCHPSPPARLNSLLSQLSASCGSLDAIVKFKIDFQHQAGLFRECLQELRQYLFSGGGEKREPAWGHLKLCVAHYCIGDYRAAGQSAIDCLQLYDSLPVRAETPEQAAALTLPTQKARHLRFLPYCQSSVLSYCCKLLCSLLQERAGAGGDLALGHLLVLVQCSWPSMRDLLYLTLHRIKMKQGLSYPLFPQYVVNIEILEEITFFNTVQGGGLTLDITPGARGTRPGTRGANRGEKEDFRMAMKRQALRSHEPVDRLIVDFLTKNAELVLQCLV